MKTSKMKVLKFLSKWLLPIACGTIMFHLYGIFRATSLLFVESIDRYHTDRNQASFPHVLRLTICYLIAPVAGFLSCHFGMERVILIGCLLSCIGMGSCFFAEDIQTVIVGWGVVSGIGLGLSVSLLYAVVSSHYKRNLTTANGIVASGSSIAGFIYPPICKVVIDYFGLSATFLILSALTLNSVPAAMLLLFSRQHKGEIGRKEEFENPSWNQEQKLKKNFDQVKFIVQSASETRSVLNSDTLFVISPVSDSNSLVNNANSEREHLKINIPFSNPQENFENEKPGFSYPELTEIERRRNINHQKNGDCTQAVEGKSVISLENTTTLKPLQMQRHELLPKVCSKFSIFCDPLFLLISLVQSFYLITLTSHHTILAEYVTDRGFEIRDAAFIIMCGALTDIAGRLVLGWVTDHGFMSVPNFSTLLFICYGLCYAAFSFCTEMVSLTLMYALIGFLMGSIMSILPALICLHFEGDKRTVALASSFIFYVPLSFAVSPLIGYFREEMGSYEEMYHLLSGTCILCAIVIVLISKMKVCKTEMCIKS